MHDDGVDAVEGVALVMNKKGKKPLHLPCSSQRRIYHSQHHIDLPSAFPRL